MEPIVPNINRILVTFGFAGGDNSPGHGIGGRYIKLSPSGRLTNYGFLLHATVPPSTVCCFRDRLVGFPRTESIDMYNRRPLRLAPGVVLPALS